MSAKTPYIGSKISLISKAEIRYEGVLYAVDTKEATVTLAKVRSFGTEGRQVPKPIPPRTDTYEFIIFRGSDIKDLHVSEIQSKAEDTAPQDPAILSATSQAPALPPASNAPPPSSSVPSSSQPPLLPPSQSSTYSPFPPAPGSFSPFNMPYFKPQVMMAGGGPINIQRPPHLPPPPTAQHTMHPLPLSSHQPFPPFVPGQLPIPLTQKSPFVPLHLPSSPSAPVISTIMRPSPGVVSEGKDQSPVASSTPHTATAVPTNTQTGDGTTTPAQTTPQAASESESPLARMNHVSPPSQVTQAPPPSLLSHIPPSLDPAPVSAQGHGNVQTAVAGNGNQQQQPTSVPMQTGHVSEERQTLHQKSSDGVKAPLISDPLPPPQTGVERRNSGGVAGRGRERSRGRGGRRNSRAGPRSGSRGGGPSNQHEPTYRYENDFDFESANAQFDKQVLEQEFKKLRVSKGRSAENGTPTTTPGGSVSEEVGEPPEEEEVEEGEVIEEPELEPEFYDKTKSFFDNISCENPRGAGNRYTNWNEERELNTETFGVSSVNRLRRGRGGARGRWRGGRGRGRGGGYGRREYYYGRGGGSRGGRGGRRDEGRDGGSRDSREERPPRGGGRGGGYYYRSSSGGYRGQGKRGRGGGEKSVGRGSVDQPARPTTTTAPGDQ